MITVAVAAYWEGAEQDFMQQGIARGCSGIQDTDRYENMLNQKLQDLHAETRKCAFYVQLGRHA